MWCLISRLPLSPLAAAEGTFSRWLMIGAWLNEDLIQLAILFCSFCVLVQIFVVWGTKWGDHHLFAKSFVLSLFLHCCLFMNWYSFSQVGKAASQTKDERPEEVKTELMAIEVRTDPMENETPLTQDNSRFGAKRPVSEMEVQRPRGDVLTEFDDTVATPTIQRDEFRPNVPAEIPMVRADVEEVVRAEVQSVASPQAVAPSERALPQVTDDAPRNEEPPPAQAPPPPRRNTTRTDAQAKANNEPESVERVRQSPPRRMKTNRIEDDGTLLNSVGDNGRVKPQDMSESDIPLLKAPPILEEIKKQPAKSTFIASGVVTNSMTGKPIAGAVIRVDQISSPSLKTKTDRDGRYQITLSDLPDNFAITASIDEFVPLSKNLSRGERNGAAPRTDFQLQPTAPTIVVVEENPEVHHVGDDRFEGRVNSQFQRRSEGASVTLQFRISQNEQQMQQVRGVVRFLAKGIQCNPILRINRTALTNTKLLSAEDGSFGSFEVVFDSALLRRGANTIEIQSTQCTADLDDFEFVNVQIRLENKE